MYSDIGQKSNTMIFSDRPADVNALLAQAGTVVKSLQANSGEGQAVNAARVAGLESTPARRVTSTPETEHVP